MEKTGEWMRRDNSLDTTMSSLTVATQGTHQNRTLQESISSNTVLGGSLQISAQRPFKVHDRNSRRREYERTRRSCKRTPRRPCRTQPQSSLRHLPRPLDVLRPCHVDERSVRIFSRIHRNAHPACREPSRMMKSCVRHSVTKTHEQASSLSSHSRFCMR